MIFITGARGFVGGELALYLATKGESIKALVRPGTKLSQTLSDHPAVTTVEGDITRYEDMVRLTEGCSEGFHLAAYAKPWAKSNKVYESINIEGALNVVCAAKENGVKKVVVTSTAGTFGPQQSADFITEEIQLKRPLFTEYERSKRESVIRLREEITSSFSICFVSPTRVYGPGELSVSNSVTRLFIKFKEEGFRFKPGNGKSVGNYVYIEDVVKGHVFALERGMAGENYILGGDNLSFNTFFKMVGEVVGIERKMIGIPVAFLFLGAHVLTIIANLTGREPAITPPFVKKYLHNWGTDLTKSKNELGYQITPFKTGVKETIEWIEQQKNS